MIMKFLKKAFSKKKKTYNTDANYKLLIIDEKAELLHEILGITDERANELTRACLEAYDKNNTLADCLVAIVDEAKHTNEVVFGTLIMDKVIQRKNSMRGVMDMFQNMFGNG